jgi:glycosyltransferase involved in cell wall biosynthesis
LSKKKKILVCICIPTYNSEKTIKNTVLSILDQSYKNIIVKIVDNASNDKTLNLISSIKDKRLKIIRSKRKTSIHENHNNCIKHAEGKYTGIFHSDDIYHKDIIKEQLNFYKYNKHVGAVFTQARFINEENKIIKKNFRFYKNFNKNYIYTFESFFKKILYNSFFLTTSSALVETRVYRRIIKKFNYKFGRSSDVDVWLRILKIKPIGVISKFLVDYRIWKQQDSFKDRTNINKADFINVLEYYIKNEKGINLTSNDWRNYFILVYRDKIFRAYNALVQNKYKKAKQILSQIILRKMFSICLFRKKGIVLLVFVLILKALIFINLFKNTNLLNFKRVNN